jgi:hypothetical protein
MTAGASILRSISWPGKSRKGKRSGSGGSEELKSKSEKRKGRMRKLSGKFRSFYLLTHNE